MTGQPKITLSFIDLGGVSRSDIRPYPHMVCWWCTRQVCGSIPAMGTKEDTVIPKMAKFRIVDVCPLDLDPGHKIGEVFDATLGSVDLLPQIGGRYSGYTYVSLTLGDRESGTYAKIEWLPEEPQQPKQDTATVKHGLHAGSAARKAIPLHTGLLMYFPNALAEVARLSKLANDKHNPGEPLHWAKDKSTDHADCLLRHQVDVGEIDLDWGPEAEIYHEIEVAWRALAQAEMRILARRTGVAYDDYVSQISRQAKETK